MTTPVPPLWPRLNLALLQATLINNIDSSWARGWLRLQSSGASEVELTKRVRLLKQAEEPERGARRYRRRAINICLIYK